MLRAIVALMVCLTPIAAAHILAGQPDTPSQIDASSLDGNARQRAEQAAALASSLYAAWLGPAPASPVAIAAAPVIDARGAMAIESDVAYRLAIAWFGERPIDQRSRIHGIAWYLQSRVVERAFDLQFLKPGYRRETLCFFGCHVRWSIPYLVTTRTTDGAGRTEYVRQSSGRAWPAPSRPASFEHDPVMIRTALVVASLERELGWPALQGALRAVAGAASAPVVETIERATGRELRRAFELAGSDARLAGVTTSDGGECSVKPCLINRATLEGGAGVPFPLQVRFEFEGNAAATVWWDGREDVIAFESTTPVTRVRLDPERVWLLDQDLSNNDYRAVTPPAPSARRWMARWILWLQDVTLMTTAIL